MSALLKPPETLTESNGPFIGSLCADHTQDGEHSGHGTVFAVAVQSTSRFANRRVQSRRSILHPGLLLQSRSYIPLRATLLNPKP